MCRRTRVVLFSLLFATMNASAQDSAPPPRPSTPKEKEQALAALTEARRAVFPIRRKNEGRQLLARIAPLLAAAGDTAGAQEVLTLLPANLRDAIQAEIVAAQLRSGEFAAALAQIAKEQESIGESADAVKTLRLAEAGVREADQGCRFETTRYLQDEDEGRPGVLQNEIAEFRERLVPSIGLAGNEEQNEEDSSNTEGSVPDSTSATPLMQLQQLGQNQQPTLTREQALAALDLLRRVKPLYQRAQAAMGTTQLMLASGKTGEAEEAIHIAMEVADTVQD